VPLDTRGTMVVGFHRDDTERIRRVYSFRESRGLPVQWLSGSEARELEPLLSPKASSAMWIPEDHQIDNRRLVDALEQQGIPHRYEEFDGTHSAIDWRLDHSLPYLASALKNAAGAAI